MSTGNKGHLKLVVREPTEIYMVKNSLPYVGFSNLAALELSGQIYDNILYLCLSLIDWDIFLNGDTVTSWNKFKALLLDLINNHVPKKVLLKKNKFKKPIRMTHRAVKLVTAKRKTFHKYKDTTVLIRR